MRGRGGDFGPQHLGPVPPVRPGPDTDRLPPAQVRHHTIATAIAEGQGGIVSITVAAVIFTGILGNLCAPALARLFRVKDPVAAGLAIGACSHAMGTARALELGETEGGP